MEQDESCKLLRFSLIVFVVSNRLTGITVAGSHLPQRHHHGHATYHVPMTRSVLSASEAAFLIFH